VHRDTGISDSINVCHYWQSCDIRLNGSRAVAPTNILSDNDHIITTVAVLDTESGLQRPTHTDRQPASTTSIGEKLLCDQAEVSWTGHPYWYIHHAAARSARGLMTAAPTFNRDIGVARIFDWGCPVLLCRLSNLRWNFLFSVSITSKPCLHCTASVSRQELAYK